MISNSRFQTSKTSLVLGILAMFGLASVAADEPESGEWVSTNTAVGEARLEGVPAPVVLFRINAGGGLVGAIDTGPDWVTDSATNPSTYRVAGGGSTNAFPVQAIESTVPASTPAAIFESERWDPAGGAEMLWGFPVADGTPVEIRLYLMNGFAGTSGPGERVFHVEVDGALAFSDIDLAAEAGHQTGTVRSYQTTADGMIDIKFLHAVDNPLINGIEILQIGTQPGVLSALPNNLNFGQVLIGTTETLNVILGNEGGDGDPVITIEQIDFSNAAFSSSLTVGNSLAPEAHLEVAVTFEPDSTGLLNATLNIAHSGSNSPLTINLSGDGIDEPPPPPIAFSFQNVTALANPTQLEFGPDGRLYVSDLKGLINALTIERDDSTDEYVLVGNEVIDLIQTLPNHNDDGTPFLSNERNVTGMITAGTADNPILYVTSSDPRIDDTDADTNSGVLSRLTWTGTEWIKLDLVRSLPRSAHDHFSNGMALDAGNGILYLAQGGNTNMGAPSFSFDYLPEYALSAAILSVDLNAIGDQTYDIPTLKGDVFGGQAGNNQAMIVSGGPVQIHSPGYRNPYDVLLTTAGRLYTYDNDSNTGWGGLPVGEGPTGNCTNDSNESGSGTYGDNFHLITGPGYYGGHPNPTRANRSNTFDGLSPIPSGFEKPGECEFLIPGIEDGAISIYNASTNGLAEYTASNFGGQLAGNIITTAWDGTVLRLSLNSTGDQVVEQVELFTSLNGPLGVAAQGDAEPFPGTIWVGQFFNGNITVFEPQDFFECDPNSLDPADTSSNGYTYGDLIDNGLDPCNPAQVPPDFDQDFVSDLNDPDIDGDGIANEQDRFDFDAENGRGTPLPHLLAWSGEVVGTLGGMTTYNAPGFTGLMAHPDTYISVFDQFNADRLIPGGAAGIFTLEEVTPGDALINTQENAFHFGVDVHAGSEIFTAQTRIMAPFAGTVPQDNQSMGLLIGEGDQNNYIKLVTNAGGGDGGIQLGAEIQGVFNGQQVNPDIIGADYVDLFLVVDPNASSVAASYLIARDGVEGPRTAVGQAIAMPASWLGDVINGLAIGIISTSSDADPFSASWSFVNVYEGSGAGFPTGHLDAAPPVVVFPDTLVGASAVQTVTLSNTGGAALEISAASMIGDPVFVTDLILPQSLEPGASQEFSITFTPDAATDFEAVLTLTHDGGNSPLEISMTGAGVPVPTPGQLDADPPSLGFPETLLGETAVLSVTLSNSGETALEISDAAITGDQVFNTDLTLPQALAPGAALSFSVSFTPDTAGSLDALLTLTHDGDNSPLDISMTGAGAEAATVPVPDPSQVDFGGVLVGSTTGQELINLTNTGQASVTVGNLEIGGEHAGDFSLDAAADTCTGAKLAFGQGCSFAVRFQPTQTGARGAQVNIPSDAGNATVSLQGQGLVLLDLEIDAVPSPAVAGSPLTYTLVVSNLASVQADNVALAITLPSETGLLTTDGCLEDPTGIPNCSIGPIPANESAEIAITVDVSSSATGTLLIQATASADQLLDPVARELTTPVVLVADLNLVMEGDAVPIDVETMELLYVIIVGNSGPSDAVSAMVMTELAPGLENIEWNCQAEATASCTASGLGEIDDLADLPSGTSVTYQLTATVPSVLIEKGLTSSANVAPSGETTDPNLDNNSDSVTIGDQLFHDRFEVIEE